MLQTASAGWARLELGVAAVLAVTITVLILLNVITRTWGAALFWVDELAIYAMVWMTFLGASAAAHFGNSVAITLLRDALPHHMARVLKRAIDLVILVFAALMLWFCWRWFNPLELARSGFDTLAFQGKTFNFIYAEPTTTLGIPKVWVWAVMWLFAIGMCLHALANLTRRGDDGTAP